MDARWRLIGSLAALVSAACATPDEMTLASVVMQPSAPAALPDRALTLDDVAKLAVQRSPQLAAARAALGVKDAEAVRAGLWPDPNMTGGVTQALASSTDGTGVAVGVDWDIGELLVRGTERDAALLDADAARLALAYQELSFAGDARITAARVVSFRAQLAVATVARESTQQVVQQAMEAQAAHDTTTADVGVKQVAALEAEARALDLEAALNDATHDLARALGLAPDTVFEVAPTQLPPDDVTGDVDALFALAKRQRADLLALDKAYQSHEHTVQAAVLRALPHLGASVEVAHDTAGLNTIGGAFTLGLPVFDGNRGTLDVERATREQLRAEYAARLFGTRADIAQILAARDHARAAKRALAARLPQLQQAEEQMRNAASQGNITTLAHLDVQAALLDAQLRALALDEQEIEQRLLLQTAVGAPGGLR